MVTRVTRRIVKSRTPKGKRADVRASSPKAKAAKERRERQLNKKRAEYKMTKKEGRALAKVTKATKPPKGIPIPPKGGVTTKGGARKVLKRFGVPGKIIAGVLALTAANQLSKPKATKTPKPGNKSNAPNPFNNRNKPSTRKAGPSGPRMTSMKAPSTGPKPRNKNVTRRPKRPSGPRMTGFRK